MDFKYNDGGRNNSGFKGETSDCVVRAISIATNIDYKKVYNDLFKLSKKSPRLGVERKYYEKYLLSLGWKWKPLMKIGSGCTTHLKKDELPMTTIIVRLSRHVATVVDGVLNDTYDCSRGGSRCVYGYYYK